MKKGLDFLFLLLPFNFFCQPSSLVNSIDSSNKAYVFFSFTEFQDRSPSIVIDKNKDGKIFLAFPKGLQKIKAMTKDSIIAKNLKNFVVKKSGLLIYKLKAGSIYGFYNNGVLFRYYAEPKNWRINDGYYKIEEIGRFVIYSIRKGNLLSSSKHYYYSLTLNSPLKYLKLKNIENDIKDPEVLNKIKNNKNLMRDIWAKDNDGKFLINNFL